MSEAPGDITVMLAAASQGDRDSAARLLPLVYQELRKLAASRLAATPPGNTLQPTALVHEAFLERFSTEIAVLVDEPINALMEVHPAVGRAIGALREGLVSLHPGGGGRYGTFELLVA